MSRHGNPPEAARALRGGTSSALQPHGRVLLDTSHPLEQISCQQRYASESFCVLVAIGVIICCACRRRETIRGAERMRGQPFPYDGTSVSHCQYVDVDVKKVTNSSLPHQVLSAFPRGNLKS